MSHKYLKQYTVVAGNKLCKVIEFSKGEAEVYVKNFIETHLSHNVLKNAGISKNITAYFTDTDWIKKRLAKEAEAISKTLTDKLQAQIPSGNGEGTENNPLNLDINKNLKKYLTDAQSKIEDAKKKITSVADGNDFNSELINKSKALINESLKNIKLFNEDNKVNDADPDNMDSQITPIKSFTVNDPKSDAIFSSGGEGDDGSGGQTITLENMEKDMNSKVNTLRKWQLDHIVENYCAEIWVSHYHEYKYADTKEELCEILNTALKSIGIDIELKAEKYWEEKKELMRTKDEVKMQRLQTIDKRPGASADLENVYCYIIDENKWYRCINTGTNENKKWEWQLYVQATNNSDPDLSPVNMEKDIRNKLISSGYEAKEIEQINIECGHNDYDPDTDGEAFKYPPED